MVDICTVHEIVKSEMKSESTCRWSVDVNKPIEYEANPTAQLEMCGNTENL